MLLLLPLPAGYPRSEDRTSIKKSVCTFIFTPTISNCFGDQSTKSAVWQQRLQLYLVMSEESVLQKDDRKASSHVSGSISRSCSLSHLVSLTSRIRAPKMLGQDMKHNPCVFRARHSNYTTDEGSIRQADQQRSPIYSPTSHQNTEKHESSQRTGRS